MGPLTLHQQFLFGKYLILGLLGYLGYVPGVCWNFLRNTSISIFVFPPNFHGVEMSKPPAPSYPNPARLTHHHLKVEKKQQRQRKQQHLENLGIPTGMSQEVSKWVVTYS